MPQFKLIVFSDPVKGREDDYHEWYNDTHLRDILTLPGFRTAQRFQTRRMERDAPCGFAAIYDIEAESIDAAIAVARSSETFPTTDAIDLTTVYAIPLVPITPVRGSTV